jgi:sulfur-carrier protein
VSVRVMLPSQLHGYSGGRAEVSAEGATLDAVLHSLDAQFPGLRFRVIDEQERLRRHMLLFVGEERCAALDTPVPSGVTVTLVGALSGG